MTTAIAPRSRKVRVLATLGPASNTPEMIATLFQAGADAFRINMSHGDQQSKIAVIQAIRALEKEFQRPTTILADLQGPKLRVGKFEGGRTVLESGSTFVLDRDATPGDATRVELPHKEIFAAIEPGARLLLDDGKLVLRVTDHGPERIETSVEVGGALSNNKGLNVPDVVLPMAALTEKDRSDLAFAVEQGVDWIALSFVQRPEDLAEARKLIGGKAALLAKIEKPQAIERLEEIVEMCDGVMVARGDLGVELPPQTVPPLQKRIVETARRLGLLWGTHAVHTRDVESFEDMVGKAKRMALRTGIAKAGDRVIVMAGVPFRTPGSTNVLHVVPIIGDELRDYV